MAWLLEVAVTVNEAIGLSGSLTVKLSAGVLPSSATLWGPGPVIVGGWLTSSMVTVKVVVPVRTPSLTVNVMVTGPPL